MFPRSADTKAKKSNKKYFVQYARTERLRKSAIIHMQRLLNRNDN